jgi:LysM repeat protein
MRRRSAAVLALALLLPLPGLAGEVVVKPGETLSEIAERHGTTVQRLMQLNNLRSPQDLWAGSRIQVPGGGGSASGGGGGRGNYTVKPGETLSEIAERYGTSVQRLMQLNGLRSPQDLWAGSRIQVPSAGGGPASSASRTTTVQANYTVKPGETLSELADRYGTSVQRLMELNNLRSTQDLWAGSRIKVPVTRTTAAAKPAVNKTATQHKVQSGESLSVIAQRYGISTQSLIAINNISDPNQVEVGRTLKLRGTPKPTAKPAAKPAAKPQTVAAKPATKPAAKPAPQPAAKPAPQAQPVAAQPTPKPAAQPAVQPAVTAAVKAEPKPEPKPVVAAQPQPQPKAEPKPEPKPAAQPVAAKPVATTKPAATTAAAKPGKPSSPDWRNYGPLQVDWANWQPMGGSYVAPSLNSDGQPLYLAINCGAKRLNATGQSGTWKTWDAPQSDFEHKLINDLCTAKGG